MLSRVHTGAVLGVDAYLVTADTDVTSGMPAFITVGLPQGAVQAGRERVIAALQNSGWLVPPRRITVDLSPSHLCGSGSAFDLAIAVGIAAATGQLTATSERLQKYLLLGELALDGGLRPVRGVLPIAEAARRAGLGIIIPRDNTEAALVEGLEVRRATTLTEVLRFLEGTADLAPMPREPIAAEAGGLDFADVKGHEQVKRALEIAAAGGHHALMVGPPGSGKTMLAQRIPGILPPLSSAERLEVVRVRSVAGLTLGGEAQLGNGRPFRSPHCTISDMGMIGGGSAPRPGEVSLAHHGVLFLDELAEYRRNVLEVLRSSFDDGCVRLVRGPYQIDLPARVMLVAAMNPCPCGWRGDTKRTCACSPTAVERYLARVPGPLLDRFDLHVEVPSVQYRDLRDGRPGEASTAIRERVARARETQARRFGDHVAGHLNARMGPKDVGEFCRIGESADALLRTAISRLGLSARAYDRILKIARTIADLDGAVSITNAHVAEAIQYRTVDRRTTE